ncbi:hypothetical protein JNUCC1_02231 [Lentibacillus sp. JNUCC-1]|nr:hypothetical protein [Lentibacillus sp. JNUCC-1]MUV38393.1 hypothetical protein [Lentibacillus sp. JNUCC-1]
MVVLTKGVKKTVLAILLLILFIAFFTLCGIVFLATLQWFMQTEFYLSMVGSVEFWIWVLGIPLLVLFFVFCSNIA